MLQKKQTMQNPKNHARQLPTTIHSFKPNRLDTLKNPRRNDGLMRSEIKELLLFHFKPAYSLYTCHAPYKYSFQHFMPYQFSVYTPLPNINTSASQIGRPNRLCLKSCTAGLTHPTDLIDNWPPFPCHITSCVPHSVLYKEPWIWANHSFQYITKQRKKSPFLIFWITSD